MAHCLTPEIYAKLSKQTTPNGYSLNQAIQTGVDNPGHPFIMTVGCVAGDEESYQVFADLFDAIIEKRHSGYTKTDMHQTDLNPANLTGGDELDDEYVLSCRVRTGRSIRGLCLPPFCSRAERREVEKIVVSALGSLEGELKGTYYPLKGMTDAEQEQLIADHFLFDKPVSPLLLAAGMARDWPDARGIWHNDVKNFLVWVNEEDHTRVISMQKGGKMGQVFKRFCDGLAKVEIAIRAQGREFMWNEHLGFVLTCPSNLGTGLRAGVHVKLPQLSRDPRFDAILGELRLQKRGTGGVDTASTDGTFDISNSDRLGTSEVQQVQRVVDGVKLLVEMEKCLEKGNSINPLLPGRLSKPLRLPSNYPDLSQHSNWMAKCLSEDVFQKLATRATPSGFTLDKVIQTGVDNPGHPYIMTVGCVAGDEESYEVFAELFDPVIEKRHEGYKGTDMHKTDLNPSNLLGDAALDEDYVLSCRVRTGRSIRGLALPPWCTRGERREVERVVTQALDKLDGPLEGKYYSLETMTEQEQDQLISDHFLFDKPVSPLLLSAGMARDWPDARGIWHNHSKNFLVWVNEEDHIRVISMERGGNMRAVFERFCTGLNKVEHAIKASGHEFMWNEHLGFLLTCPSNLGTGLRAGVHIRIPLLSQQSWLPGILAKLRLQRRGTGGVDTAWDADGIVDISNLDRLGSSEVEQVQRVVDGVKLLIVLEKVLRSCGADQTADLVDALISGEAIAQVVSRGEAVLRGEHQGNLPPVSNYPDLSAHQNLMSRFLTRDMYDRLSKLKTTAGFTLDQVIQSGVDNPSHPHIRDIPGCIAGDEDSYRVFAELFDPVIEARHNGYKKGDTTTSDLDADKLVGCDDLDEDFVLSCRVRTGRNIRGLSLLPHCTRAERREVKAITERLFSGLGGSYFALGSLDPKTRAQLTTDRLLFDRPLSPLVLSSGIARDWPDARGVWHNDGKDFAAWVNEEDHLRLFSVQKGGNMKETFKRFCTGVQNIQARVAAEGKQFMHNDHHGYISSCPCNLGTGLRAGVHVKLPLLGNDPRFDVILTRLRLQRRGAGDESNAADSGLFDISNTDRLGGTEVQLVQHVVNGVKLLVLMEKTLTTGDAIDDLIPN